MLKIYGSPLSSAGRCYWMMDELGLEYQRIPLDMAGGEHKQSPYLSINPNGKVPTLIDGDKVLFESMAITNYLAEKYPSDMTPKNALERGEVLQWSFWALSELQVPAVEWLIQAMFVPEDKRDMGVIERAKKKIPGIVTVLDQKLRGKSYLVGERFTVADLNVASVVNLLAALRYDLTPFQEVTRWMTEIQKRPAFQKFVESRTH